MVVRKMPCLVLFSILSAAAVVAQAGSGVMQGNQVDLYYPAQVMTPEQAAAVLRQQEEALARVEQFLGTSYARRVRVTLEVGPNPHGGTSPGEISYIRPLADFLSGDLLPDLHGTTYHEMAHLVAFEWERPVRKAHSLREALASAVAAEYDATVFDYHLASAGWLHRGVLPAIRVAGDTLVAPKVADGSFVWWLIHRYGNERFRKLYAFAGPNAGAVESFIERTYGKTLGALEQEWHDFLVEHASGKEQHAVLLSQAVDAYFDAAARAMRLYTFHWAGYLVDTPSRVWDAYRQALASLSALGWPGRATRDVRQLYDDAMRAIAAWAVTLDATVAAYEEAVYAWLEADALISSGASPEAIIEPLRRSRAAYERAGDFTMAGKVATYIQGLDLLARAAQPSSARDELLTEALNVFSRLGDRRLVEEVERALSSLP